MDLIASIALAHEGWPWCGKEIQESVKLYFKDMGCNLTALHGSDVQFPPEVYEIVVRAIEKQDQDIRVLIQQAATPKLPAHFQILQSDVEKKMSMLCLSKALMESIQTKIGCLDATGKDRVVSVLNTATDVMASHQYLQDTTSLSPDML
jgi:hypothetical protein